MVIADPAFTEGTFELDMSGEDEPAADGQMAYVIVEKRGGEWRMTAIASPRCTGPRPRPA